jgi:hypothetical protein
MPWGQPQQHRYAVLCGVLRAAAPSLPPTLRLRPHCLVLLRRVVAMHFADRGVQVDGDCPVTGAAQAAHALARVVSVSRSSWRTCPKVKAHKKVPSCESRNEWSQAECTTYRRFVVAVTCKGPARTLPSARSIRPRRSP